MVLIFPKPMCPKCGSAEILQHACLHDVNGNWLTKKQRLTNPSIISKCQMSMYVADKTWLTCVKCNYELNEKEITTLFQECKRLSENKPLTFSEEIGIPIINSRALNRL